MTTGVFYLWRRGNPHNWLRAFLHSLEACPAGADFDLVLMRKGFESGEAVPPLATLAAGASRVISWSVEDALFPIEVFFRAAETFDYDRVIFLVSQSRIRAANWLASLSTALDGDDVGLVGATGSYEAIPGAPFPNPTIRTTGFLIDRRLFLSLARGAAGRRGGLEFEGGVDSMTRQIERQGLRALVVDAQGAAWEAQDWPRSRTFRSGVQEHLLIADNRTRHFAMSAFAKRRKLARLAFGEAADPASSSLLHRARARFWPPT